MVKAELGVKRTCLSCSMRFYDFKRRPIICPGCGAEFDSNNLIKRNQKSRVTQKTREKSDTPDNAIDLDDSSNNNDGKIGQSTDDSDENIEFDEDDVRNLDEPGTIQDDIIEDDDLLPSLNDKED